MKSAKIIFTLLTLFCVSLHLQAGKIITESMQSKVLNAERHYNVYLPDGYDPNGDRTYPVLYLLHGLGDDHTGWTIKGNLQIVVDELIRSEEVVPLIIIMPNADGDVSKGDWCGYFNMPGWPYEQFFFNEFTSFFSGKLTKVIVIRSETAAYEICVCKRSISNCDLQACFTCSL